MSADAQGGGVAAPTAPSSNGQPGISFGIGAPIQRSRVEHFGSSAETGQIALENPGLVQRGQDPSDPWSPLESADGQDAQSQALVVDDSVQGELVDGSEEQQAAANALTEADVRRMLDEYRAWADSDDLAQPLQGKFVVATVNGQRYRIPVEEAVKGYQRTEDYSNKMREIYALKAQIEQREQGLRNFIADLNDPQNFMDAMMRLGKFDAFVGAAHHYGKQLKAERSMSPEQRQVFNAMREMRVERQRLAAENARLQAQLGQVQQQTQQQEPQGLNYQAYMQQLNYMLPRVAERIGFERTPLSMKEFETHFMNMLPSLQGSDLTSDFIETCMRAAQDAVARHIAAGYAQPEPEALPPPGAASMRAPNGRFAPQQRTQQLPAPAARAAGQPAPVVARNQRSRIGEFDRGVRGRL